MSRRGVPEDEEQVLLPAAIVARELGIPCVIGTGDGTRRIATGDLLSVDGSTGVVTISERAVAASGAER